MSDKYDLKKIVNTVICDDCITALRRMPDKCVDLTITSPPYNMGLSVSNGKYNVNKNLKKRKGQFIKKYEFFDDSLPIEEYYEFHKSVLIELMRVSNLVFWNIEIVTGSKEAVFKIIGDFNKNIKDIIIWDKGYGPPASNPSVLNSCVEYIIIFQDPAQIGRSFPHCNYTCGTLDNIWRLNRLAKEKIKEHGAVFPRSLVINIIKNWSNGGIVLDPFGGSGTTAIACLETGCDFILVEMSPKYVDIINDRISKWKKVPRLIEPQKLHRMISGNFGLVEKKRQRYNDK